MNAALTISKTYHQRVSDYFWGATLRTEDGIEPHLGDSDYDHSAVTILEQKMGVAVGKLSNRQYTGVNLTVKLPEGVTLTEAYKTMVRDKYTADGTIGTITFE
ncbi:hypothetical protein [Cohnella phaseoli]|uniref:Uncharacterized protein n=1 Tax=Cohnella phaseoli TaxID=456490 RepID=A0A3D9KK00_9BACL|nr:hypothetical protein [Cohnella phaseoli]RED86206.1 hypothetical protein DFP98_10357 [Cohnella phaseoli]